MSDPFDYFTSKQRNFVLEAYYSLPEKLRTVLLVYWSSDQYRWTEDYLAMLLDNTTPNSARVRLSRAKKKIFESVEDKFDADDFLFLKVNFRSFTLPSSETFKVEKTPRTSLPKKWWHLFKGCVEEGFSEEQATSLVNSHILAGN